MGYKKSLLVVFLALVAIGITSGALLSVYVTLSGGVDVQQSVVFSDDSTEKSYTYEATAGDSFCEAFELKNRAEVPATISFSTSYDPDGEGITTTYWKNLEYSDTKTTTESLPAVITVEDLGDAIRWTVDMDETDEDFANGHAALGLVIGKGNDILFQIHSNDGTDANYEWGTWLYSRYYPGEGWHGWKTSTENTPVDELDWVSATGDRYLSDNPELIFTITIAKDKLYPEFKWAMALMGDTSDTFTPDTYSWSDEDTTNFHEGILAEQITDGYTLNGLETVGFAVCNAFDVALEPGQYTITTEVVPTSPE